MALSYTEKQHWANRVAKIVDTKIKELKSSSATILDSFNIRAEQEISDRLQIIDDLAAHEKAQKEIEELEAGQRELLAMIAVSVYGDEPPYRLSIDDIHREVKSLVTEKADELFAEHPLGEHLQSLEEIKDRLMNQTLLATTVQQITHLLDKAETLSAFPDLPEENSEAATEREPMLMLSEYSVQ